MRIKSVATTMVHFESDILWKGLNTQILKAKLDSAIAEQCIISLPKIS